MISDTGAKGTNVQVAVRMRPLNAEEKKSGQPSVVAIESESKSVKVSYGPVGKKITKSFVFDKVFGSYSRQEEVFDTVVRPIVNEVLDGFNCTVFAYGQTGTGKTHTMEGDINSEDNMGIVPRAVTSLLEKLENTGFEFTVRCSFLELYNEELQDLLSSDKDKKLKLCEDAKKGVVCQNLEEIAVLNIEHILNIIQKGIKQRQTAATLCNKNSSRSHSIFTMKLMIKECNIEGEEVVRHGQLNLVDLAGSECVGRSGATDGRAREAGSINQSLLTLGRVITALVDHHGHIPYRDSKLTRLLQESLGGKAKTSIIATFSPVQSAVEETMSTLDYAYRARSIKNQPTANEKLTKKVVMKEYFAEIENLRFQLSLAREKNGVYLPPDQFYAMETKLQAQENQLTECEEALRSHMEVTKVLKAEKDELVGKLVTAKTELDQTSKRLKSAEVTLEETKVELYDTAMDLQATEDVVTEQVVTETSLLGLGQEMRKDLSEREGEVDSLLGKVQVLQESENKRIVEAQEMVSQLTNSGAELASQLEVFRSENKDHSEALCEGVSQLLSRGKSTCVTLTQSIESALGTLIGEAEVARDGMTQSCDRMKEKLQGTNKNVETTLRDLQEQLSAWLGDADKSMAQAQEHLTAQQTMADQMSSHVSKHTKALQKMNKEFVAHQEALSKQSAAFTEELKSHLMHKLKDYETQYKQHVVESKNALTLKAKEIETAVASMLQDLVKSNVSSGEAAFGKAVMWCSEMGQQLETSTNSLTNIHGTVYDSVVEQYDMVVSSSDAARAEYLSGVEGLKSSGTAASTTLEGVSKTVGAKRKHLEETVTVLVENVGTAMDQASNEADVTSKTATMIVKDVGSAATVMKDAAFASADDFTAFMGKEGEVIRNELGAHFEGADSHIGKQQQGANGSMTELKTYGETMVASRVVPAGSTPTKGPQRKVRILNPTREHIAIREESKARFVGGSTGSIAPRVKEELRAREEPVSLAASSVDSLPQKMAVAAIKEKEERVEEVEEDGEGSAEPEADGNTSSRNSEASTQSTVSKSSASSKSNRKSDNENAQPNNTAAKEEQDKGSGKETSSAKTAASSRPKRKAAGKQAPAPSTFSSMS